MSLAVLSRAACASMSTTTTTTRDRGDSYGLMEWAQLSLVGVLAVHDSLTSVNVLWRVVASRQSYHRTKYRENWLLALLYGPYHRFTVVVYICRGFISHFAFSRLKLTSNQNNRSV